MPNDKAGTGMSPPCRGTGQAVAMLTHAYLAVVRLQANTRPGARKGRDAGWDAGLLPFTVPEVGQLLCWLIRLPRESSK